MTRLKQVLIYTALFLLSTWTAFQFENPFRQLIRNTYTSLTDNDILFIQPGKYIHFPSPLFIISFGLFVAIFYYLLTNHTINQRIRIIVLAVLIFVASLTVHCYFDGLMKIVVCTACSDGKRTLRFNDIEYDLIFISSLTLSIIPACISEIKRRIKNAKNMDC